MSNQVENILKGYNDYVKIEVNECSNDYEEEYKGFTIIYEAPNDGYFIYNIVLNTYAYSYDCQYEKDFDYQLDTIKKIAHDRIDDIVLRLAKLAR